MSIGRRIALARERAGINQSELGRRLGVSGQAVSSWETEETEPRGKRVDQISRILGVSRVFLLGLSDEVSEAPAPASRQVPLISWVQAGEFSEAVDLYYPGDGETWLTPHKECSPCSFALRVEGESMTSPHGQRTYPPKTIIFVDPEVQADSNTRVVAKDSEGHVTFKEYVVDAGRHYLKPLNPQYETIRMNGEWEIVGVVIGAYLPE